MAKVSITMKIMPESPETDLSKIQNEATKLINEVGEVMKTSEEPVAFGLKSINLIFLMDEDKGSTEELEAKLKAIENVVSADVIDVRRTLG